MINNPKPDVKYKKKKQKILFHHKVDERVPPILLLFVCFALLNVEGVLLVS